MIWGQQLLRSISFWQKSAYQNFCWTLHYNWQEKMGKGERFCLLSFPFNSLILERQSGRGPCAGRPFVFYVMGC